MATMAWDLHDPLRPAQSRHAVEAIVETARANQGALTVACLGPRTNLATALQLEPRLSDWIGPVTLIGGSHGIGHMTPTTEFNFWCDRRPPPSFATIRCARASSATTSRAQSVLGKATLRACPLGAADRRVGVHHVQVQSRTGAFDLEVGACADPQHACPDSSCAPGPLPNTPTKIGDRTDRNIVLSASLSQAHLSTGGRDGAGSSARATADSVTDANRAQAQAIDLMALFHHHILSR